VEILFKGYDQIGLILVRRVILRAEVTDPSTVRSLIPLYHTVNKTPRPVHACDGDLRDCIIRPLRIILPRVLVPILLTFTNQPVFVRIKKCFCSPCPSPSALGLDKSE
jgi:hypothetical protein